MTLQPPPLAEPGSLAARLLSPPLATGLAVGKPPGSPNRVRERIDSARRLSARYEQSLNAARRHLRASSHARSPERGQATNILGQPIMQRSSSASKPREELIKSGRQQVSSAQEDKLKKQKEYREFLDMQQRLKSNPSTVSKRPPVPAPGGHAANALPDNQQ